MAKRFNSPRHFREASYRGMLERRSAAATAVEDDEEEKAYELRQRELIDAVNDGKACPGLIDGCGKLGSIRDAETRKDLVNSVCTSDFAVCYGLIAGRGI